MKEFREMIPELSKHKTVGIRSLVVGGVLCMVAGVGISSGIERYQSGLRLAHAAERPSATVKP